MSRLLQVAEEYVENNCDSRANCYRSAGKGKASVTTGMEK